MQAIFWMYGIDTEVHDWLGQNPLIVTLSIVCYIAVYELIFDATRRAQKARYQGALKGSSVRIPRAGYRPRRDRNV